MYCITIGIHLLTFQVLYYVTLCDIHPFIHRFIHPSNHSPAQTSIYILFNTPPHTHTHINYCIDTYDAFCIQMHVWSISPCFLIILATLVSVSWFVFIVSWRRGACELLHALSGREGRLRLLVFEGAGSQRRVLTEKMLPFRSNSMALN